MTPRHHPLPETLVSYAAGTLTSAISCVVACHLSLCRECADHARWLGMVGGVMLGKLETPPADRDIAERAAALWPTGRQPMPEDRTGEAAADATDPVLPEPLTRYLGRGCESVPWKTVVKGVRQHWIRLPKGAGQIRLLRLTPGKLLLEHTHTGMELTLVLQGVYGDHSGHYRRGDVIEWTEGTLHQPRASGEEECICLIGTEKTPRFTRLAARLLRPIMGF